MIVAVCLSVCLSVCQFLICSVCLSVCEQDYCKSNLPIASKLDVMTGPKNRKKN